MRFISQAFLGEEGVQPRREFPREYDSKALTELLITATLTSQKDVDDLIKYLQIHKYCFEK